MKAVILAGGRGERLRPLTDTRPKPLVPVLARPVMDYVLSLISHHGVTEAYVTTHYLAHQISRRYGDGAFGMRLRYALEEEPLGTAGGVKRLEEALKNEEMFLVISGDALCDFDLDRAFAFHREKKADATVILSSVKTPLDYGVVLLDSFEKIFSFSEKPDWSETFSDQVNTGVYILSPKVLDKIPAGQPFDFARDLFPRLLADGDALFGYKDEGYWCDIGLLPALVRCNRDLLRGKARTFVEPAGTVRTTADGEGLCFIADGAKVDEDAHVGPDSVLSSGTVLKKGSRVSGSILLERARLEEDAAAECAILCEDVRLSPGSAALPGSVLGAGAALEPGARAENGATLSPHTTLTSPPVFARRSFDFTEEGVAQDGVPGVDREGAEQLGAAFAAFYQSDIGVFRAAASPGGSYFASAFAAGVQRGGRNARFFGAGDASLAGFTAADLRLPLVLVDGDGDRGLIRAFDRDGLPPLRREVLKIVRCAEESRAPATGAMGLLLPKEAPHQAYRDALARELRRGSERLSVSLSGTLSEPLLEAAVRCGIAAYHSKERHGLHVEVHPEGVKLFLDRERLADTEKLRLFLVRSALAEGRRFFTLPEDFPRIIRDEIRAAGARYETFALRHTNRAEEAVRRDAARERWLYDPPFLAARVLGRLRGLPEDAVREDFRSLPDVFITELHFYPKEENKAKLLTLAGETAGKDKKVRLVPGFYGIRIVSEALSLEAALDQAFETRGKLYDIEKSIGEG